MADFDGGWYADPLAKRWKRTLLSRPGWKTHGRPHRSSGSRTSTRDTRGAISNSVLESDGFFPCSVRCRPRWPVPDDREQRRSEWFPNYTPPKLEATDEVICKFKFALKLKTVTRYIIKEERDGRKAERTLNEEGALAKMRGFIFGFSITRSIAIAAELGIADRLADGPRTPAELAGECGVLAQPIYR